MKIYFITLKEVSMKNMFYNMFFNLLKFKIYYV
nr:MAG TPA: hypothetical protein [Caudoviricetes sp.]